MQNRSIVIMESDAQMLRGLLAARMSSARDQEHLEELSLELERAQVVRPSELPPDVVTMQTRVRVLDLTSGERREVELVPPAEADVSSNRISVLAPLGTALLGYREGDEVEWVMPGGLRRLRIEKVIQPADLGGSGAGVTTKPSGPLRS
ncbi:MAG: nucleoside diphosphate kinase regulator [Steroidobacteraceae bacterium]|jgi:regulator of nucleoside diphosphate kinase|nr:nucleoside diphosphate kinase regulator [Steroidobacteraceae bacterium]